MRARLLRLIPLLTDPAGHGANLRDAFDVVVPSLPGFGFSARPTRPGMSNFRIAELWASLMDGLGYPRYGSPVRHPAGRPDAVHPCAHPDAAAAR
jgi:pimeloyl-ACP methyl ester carboxylesterase